MRKFSLVICFLFQAVFAYAADLPPIQGWVNDFAGVISPAYKQKLSSLIEEVEQKTSAEIFVVTVNSIAPYEEQEYARLLFDSWKPGKQSKDNGVLILLAAKERRWRIETGYGVEGILPDGLCGQIGRDNMVPYFKEGDFGAGLYYGTLEISRIIAKDAQASLHTLKELPASNIPARQKWSLFPYVSIFALLFFLIWNIPWPIFIGLPFTLVFSLGLGIFPLIGYLGAMVIRYFIWRKMPVDKRKSFLWVLIFGLVNLSKGKRGHSGNFGGWSGGGGGGGFGGGGGGSSGGGGAGGRF